MPKTANEHRVVLLSTAQVAEILNKDVTTINRWADKGKLPTAAKAPGLRGARLFDADVVDQVKRSLAPASP